MRLIVDQSLATGFIPIPINIGQQRASLPFKPGVLERKVYNNDSKTFIYVFTFAKPEFDSLLQHLPLRGSGCNTLSHLGLANVNTRKRMFYPLNEFFSQCSYVVEYDNLFLLNAYESWLKLGLWDI